MLLDPSFQLPQERFHCRPAEYRPFDRRPSLHDEPADFDLPTSNREALVRQLKDRFQTNKALLDAARQDSFVLLGDLYRLGASNWVVINEYINRELATIEYNLEKEEPGFRDLEVYLKDLYIFRRRCVKYHQLITEAREQCGRRGQKSWSQDAHSSIAAEYAKDVEEDFVYLQAKTRGTKKRIAKNIELLTSLVAIGTGKQGLDENHGVARLTLLAIVFAPFATVAAILGVNGKYGPGGPDFWVFWIVAVPVTLLIFVISALFGGIGSSVLEHVSSVLRFKKMENRHNAKTRVVES